MKFQMQRLSSLAFIGLVTAGGMGARAVQAQPLSLQLQTASAVTASVSVGNTISTDGVCGFHIANTATGRESPAMSMNYQMYMLEFLPKYFVNQLNKGISEEALAKMSAWDASLKVEITRDPAHGKMINDTSVSNHPAYLPDKDFVGNDRVEVMVSGMDLNGTPISKKVIFFINVVSNKEMDRVVSNYKSAIAKYCGASKPVWRISNATNALLDVDAAASNMTSLQRGIDLSALIASAIQEPAT